MGPFSAICSNLSRKLVSLDSRPGVHFSKKHFYCKETFGGGSSPTLLAAQMKEVRTILTRFLKEHGLGNALALRTVNKSERFVEHLVSRLHNYKSCPIPLPSAGKEITSLDIKDALIPYLKTLLEKHSNVLVDVVQNFPNPPITCEDELVALPVSQLDPILSSRKIRALSQATESESDSVSQLSPRISYLGELGLDPEKIKKITRKVPVFANYSLEEKIKPVVEFLLDLGLSKPHVCNIINKWPQLCGSRFSEDFMSVVTFFENLGVEKEQLAKMIYRFPRLVCYSAQKVEATVDFLYEMGVSPKDIGKTLVRNPCIVCHNVKKLQSKAEYFNSLGTGVADLLVSGHPQIFNLSIEGHLKPTTTFFLERGFSIVEVGAMASRFGGLYTLNVERNIKPKLEFFETMDYPRSALFKCPVYFALSLEGRIKPRYALINQSGVNMSLGQLILPSEQNFQMLLENKMKKLICLRSNITQRSKDLQTQCAN